MILQNRVTLGDCRILLPRLPENHFDSCVTDPPYNLGFMGKAWDKTGIAFDPDTWRLVFNVLKPGAHLLAFGGTRTHHRMVCAIEDAGFEIRDELQWLYGKGMPKNSNLGGGWGTALKPAHNPICLARKPISEKTIRKNFQKYKCGGLNINATRLNLSLIDKKDKERVINRNIRSLEDGYGFNNKRAERVEVLSSSGRWPSNVFLDENTTSSLDLQTKGSPSRFFYCSREAQKERGEYNTHLTVKPIKLLQYLCRLITPPNGLVLDPFAGSGTTGLACRKEDFSFIGMDIDPESVYIANRRLLELGIKVK